MKLKKAKKGFTLVELVVVIAIIAILSTVSVVGYLGFTKKANVSGDKALVSQLNTILKADQATNG
ncbi:MAG TPA: pilin, partial [Firmicutes bacterium]|nr:pilin [Bacillota bacterium]